MLPQGLGSNTDAKGSPIHHLIRSVSLALLIATAPAALSAATGLRGTMHAWKRDLRSVRSALSGRAPYDEAMTRAALQRYIADAGSIEASINSHSAEARDFKARFGAFQADATAALRDVPQRTALAGDFSRLTNDCQSCHDRYN